MRQQHLSELNKGSHNMDVYLDRALALQDAGEHRHPLLSESQKLIS